MTTLSVPLPNNVENALKSLVNSGYASNKAEAARKAILMAEEEASIATVLESQQCIKDGKILRGNPRELLKKLG